MSVGLLFSAVLGQLPLLAVVVTGFVMLTARRARLSRRSVLLARAGLTALVVSIALQVVWSLLIPSFYRLMDSSVMRYSMVFSLIGLFTAVVSAAGIGLLIAAVVTRDSGQGVPGSAIPGPGHSHPGYPHHAQPVGPDPGRPPGDVEAV